MITVEQEVLLRKQYASKALNAEVRGLEFSLTFAQFKRVKLRKTCTYTGLRLNSDSRTLERIDNSIGYTKENTIACHSAFNSIKGTLENPNNDFEIKHLERMLRYLTKKKK